jgi:hypothetical protein
MAGRKAPGNALPADIDLAAAYKHDAQDLVTDITVSRYSNLAYIQVTPRDVCIDFLEMPGIRRGERMVVSGARIHMSHEAARRLAEALGGVLDRERKGAFAKSGGRTGKAGAESRE